MGSSGYLSRGCAGYPKPTHKNESFFKHGCNKLDVYDWLKDIPSPEQMKQFDIVEVRFKNCRKDFYRLSPGIDVSVGDIIAVEASPGHDIGIVTLAGNLVWYQMRKKKINPATEEIKKGFEATIPLGRYGNIEEFGKAGAFLLSPAASYITGVSLSVDGGIMKTVW